MRVMSAPPVGKTKDAGWQIGVSRTVAHDLDAVWDFLLSSDGLGMWLGEGLEPPLVVGQEYRTADATCGEIRSLRPHDRIRLTWQPPGRSADATVQVAVTPAATGTTLRFHTERLADSTEREHMRAHWKSVADTIEAALADRS